MYEISPLFWFFFAGAAFAILYPADAEMLPRYLSVRVQLFLINTYLRVFAFYLWLRLPTPRPPFRFIPVQDREPLK
jgi:hypothetical protein